MNNETETKPQVLDLKVFMAFGAYNVSGLQGTLPFVYFKGEEVGDYNLLRALEVQKKVNINEVMFTQGVNAISDDQGNFDPYLNTQVFISMRPAGTA